MQNFRDHHKVLEGYQNEANKKFIQKKILNGVVSMRLPDLFGD